MTSISSALPARVAWIGPDGPSLRLVACPHPLTTQRIDLVLPAGGTLADLLAIAQPDPRLRRHAHIFIGDHRIAPCYWRSTRPKPGQTVTIRAVIPAGGGGGGGGKNPLRTVLTLAVIVAASVFGGPLGQAAFGLSPAPLIAGSTASLASLVGGALITVAGTLAVNAIAPPPKASVTDLSRGTVDRVSPTLSITGSSNQADPYGVVPRVFGRMRVFPKKAARDYTEVVGTVQWLRCLFDFGYGPLDLSELRIGAVPLEQFDGVELEVRQGWPGDDPVTLYSSTIREDAYSLKVAQATGRQIVETRDAADEITVDLAWNGLVYFDDNGNRQNHSVTVRIEWRAVGAADWTLHTEEAVTAATDSGYRKGWRIITGAPGRYQVAVTRVSADSSSSRYRDECYLTAVRTIQYSTPVKAKGRCLVAMRIKATDQLNGAVSQFSAVAQARLPVWTGYGWVLQATRNPAWAFVDVLTGRANKNAVATTRLDLPAIKAWADACDAIGDDGLPRWTFDAVIDYGTTVFELLRDIAASARAALSMRDGLFSVVRDQPQTVPVQMFTPRNSWGFRGSKVFFTPPHALRVRYIEPGREWSQQEVTCYADGYDEATATRYDTLETFGCTSRSQAWREGRYHMAVVLLRPETYEFSADIEHLVCTRGDLITVAHDVPLWGGAWGRIKAVIRSAEGRVVGCQLDETITMEAGKHYVMRVRSTAVSPALSIETVPGETDQVMFTSPVPVLSEPDLGDLVIVGEAGRESVQLIVRSIQPGPDLTAKLVCVDAAPAVHVADSGSIPPYDPGMSLPPINQLQPPRAPILLDVRSDESVLIRADGRLQPRIVILFALDTGFGTPAASIQAQYRRSGSGENWWPVPPVSPSAGQMAIAPVEEGQAYDVWIRAISRAGLASDWVKIISHTVVGRTSLPPAVSGFSVDVQPDGVRLRWDAITVPDFDTIEIREGPDWGTGTFVARSKVTDLFLGPLPARAYRWWIKAVDVIGLMSATAAQVTATIAAPGTPMITVQVIDNFVTLAYPTPPGSHLIQHYEVRRGQYLAGADVLGDTDGAFRAVFEPSSGSYTYWIRAMDIAGNAGPWGRVVATVAQPTDYVLLVDWVSSLGGVKTNAVTEAGRLLVPVDTAQTWEQHFVARGWTSVQDQIDAGYDLYAHPTPGASRYVEVFDYGTSVHNVLVTAALDKTAISGVVDVRPLLEVSTDGVAWAAAATGWQAAVAALRYLRVTLDITATDDTALAALSLTVSIDIKLKDDSGTATANASDIGGTWVPFNRSFIDVSSITVTPQGTTPISAVYDFLDVPDPAGFKVLLFDRSGGRVSGPFSWTARGY